MPKQKTDLQKHTLNLRPGDFAKMGEIFPEMGASESIRTLVSRFVDKHYQQPTSIEVSNIPLTNLPE